MLEVKQLTRSYGSFKAVDDVSFTMGKGEIVGLLGHNGAGKTTIMKMISGFLEPDQGTISVDNICMADKLKDVQMGLGYLPENLPVYPEMVVADYLDYAADLKGLNTENKQSEIQRVIKATDLSVKLLAPISTLSRGYKQRVGVAQAILGCPKLLILDEPTNGLDPEQTRHMRDLIRDIAKGATVILSTHIMQEVDALCTRVLILRSGGLAVDAQLEDLRRSSHVLLETSASEQKMQTLRDIQGVDAVQLLESHESNAESNVKSSLYRIEISPSLSLKILSANLAEAIVQMGHQLYRLLPEHRDLETLFREVNAAHYQEEVVNHAA